MALFIELGALTSQLAFGQYAQILFSQKPLLTASAVSWWLIPFLKRNFADLGIIFQNWNSSSMKSNKVFFDHK